MNKPIIALLSVALLHSCAQKPSEAETIACDYSSQIGAAPELRLIRDDLFVKHGTYDDIRISAT